MTSNGTVQLGGRMIGVEVNLVFNFSKPIKQEGVNPNDASMASKSQSSFEILLKSLLKRW